jgi:hypothetical protein
MRIYKRLSLMTIFIGLIFAGCKPKNANIPEIFNSSPKFALIKGMSLEKKFSLDVTRISIFSKDSQGFNRVVDFDKEDNIYILDTYESTFFVFNKQGHFLRSFGRKGQGPEEFNRPSAFVINNEKIFVFEGFQELKIVDLYGKYISKQGVQIENRLDVKYLDKYFYIFRGRTDQKFEKLELILSVADESLYNGKDIFSYNYPPGLKGALYNVSWFNWLLISNSRDFYFPEDNLNKYSIIKYNYEGKPILKMSRKYEIIKYSDKALKRIYEKNKKAVDRGEVSLPGKPPVIVNIFQDYKKNIWLVVGETDEDNGNPDFMNTIDIFSERGEWLYSFKTKNISRNTIYHNGYLYNVSPFNTDTFDQFMDVYRLDY